MPWKNRRKGRGGNQQEAKFGLAVSLKTVLLHKMDYIRMEHAVTHQTPRAHSLHVRNANAEPDSNSGQLHLSGLSCVPEILAGFFSFSKHSVLFQCYKQKHNSTETSPLTCKCQSVNIKMGTERDFMRCVQIKWEIFHLPAVI